VIGFIIGIAYTYILGFFIFSVILEEFGIWYFIILATPPVMVATVGSLRITVTASKVRFLRGFLFHRRTVSYDEIADIELPKNPSFFKINQGRTRPWSSRKPNEFEGRTSETEKSVFVVNLRDGDFLLIGSVHVQEVLGAIKKAQPHIEIKTSFN